MKILVGVFALFALGTSAGRASAAPCDSLTNLDLPDVRMTRAEVVPAGTFTLPADYSGLPVTFDLATLPAFCRAEATLTPSSDSDITIEVWMPTEGWNEKFLGVGNGGWAGSLSYGALADGVNRGYAAASTDTGHKGSGVSATFALGHPEELVDFGYRAVHEMTVAAKAIVSRFYEDGPRFSYWDGCSTGGKQGLTEAQRFPADYDGIVAGAPANYWTHLMVGGLWVGHATLTDPASYIDPDVYGVIHAAVMEACDALDGVTDGVLENPARCRFDPAVLECGNGADGPCLTPAQTEAVRKIHGPVTNPRTGEQLWPGLAPGSEPGWGLMAGGPQPFPIQDNHFKYVVFEDPEWDFRTLDFDRDVALADEKDNGVLNATDPDLRPFIERGGKLILWHGWSDQLITPFNTVNYYNEVVSTVGPSAMEGSVRLFMAPGMAHCAGGNGPNRFDALAALERWVEQGEAPERIIASRVNEGRVDRTRPLCPYPQVARYAGSGSTDDADNFVCALPEPVQ